MPEKKRNSLDGDLFGGGYLCTRVRCDLKNAAEYFEGRCRGSRSVAIIDGFDDGLTEGKLWAGNFRFAG
jgi:hypothetical protein